MTAFTQAELDALEKPVRKPRIGKAVKGGASERVIQRGIVKALRKLGFMVFHVPNGSHLVGGYRQWQALQADGAMPGFPGLLCFDRDGEVAAIEVKKPGGVVSADQERCHKALKARRVRVAVVTSLDETLAELTRWGWI